MGNCATGWSERHRVMAARRADRGSDRKRDGEEESGRRRATLSVALGLLGARLFRRWGLSALPILCLTRNGVAASQPARQVNVGATARAERAIVVPGRTAADRTTSRRRPGAL